MPKRWSRRRVESAVAGDAPEPNLDPATVARLQRQLDDAVETTVARRQEGADDAVLSETLIAMRTAQALEVLTGVCWDQHLADRAAPSRPSGPSPSPR